MPRTEPRFRLEERRDCVLIWNERDFSMPRRMVCSFPSHPYDKGEAFILAEICTEALNRELPGLVAQGPEQAGVESQDQVTVAQVAPAPTASVAPDPVPQPARPQATPHPAKQARKPMPDVSHLTGRAKVAAMRDSLFSGDQTSAEEVG